VLPLGEHDPEGANFTTTRRLVSRQHPAKVMVMAVVGKPDPIHNFNGKISLKRVSRKKKTNKYLIQPRLLHKPQSP